MVESKRFAIYHQVCCGMIVLVSAMTLVGLVFLSVLPPSSIISSASHEYGFGVPNSTVPSHSAMGAGIQGTEGVPAFTCWTIVCILFFGTAIGGAITIDGMSQLYLPPIFVFPFLCTISIIWLWACTLPAYRPAIWPGFILYIGWISIAAVGYFVFGWCLYDSFMVLRRELQVVDEEAFLHDRKGYGVPSGDEKSCEKVGEMKEKVIASDDDNGDVGKGVDNLESSDGEIENR